MMREFIWNTKRLGVGLVVIEEIEKPLRFRKNAKLVKVADFQRLHVAMIHRGRDVEAREGDCAAFLDSVCLDVLA